GGPSGRGAASPDGLVRLAPEVGITGRGTVLPPQSRAGLTIFFYAANLVAGASYLGAFGFGGVGAPTCGTPGGGGAVGGLPVAVRDGISGTLVSGHNVDRWADALDNLLRLSAPQAEAMGRAAVAHAATFSWQNTTDALLASYRRAIGDFTAERQRRG